MPRIGTSGHQRRPERPGLAGVRPAQNHDGDAHDHEGEQCTDVDHLADVVDRRDAANHRSQQPDQHRVLPRRTELGVDIGEELPRQQPVLGHRVQDARLTEQHDQHHAGESGERPERDDVRRGGQAAIQKRARDRRFDVDFLEWHHAGEDCRHKDVKQVHAISEVMMPMGKSRCGFLASCAVVDTASNPI